MAHPSPPPRQPVPGVKNMVAVSSGKGGVGKSTISVNLAVALAQQGLNIGLLDTDIYGPNIPGMLGLKEKPAVAGESGLLLPCLAYGLKVISMGLLIEKGAPVIWRGPLLAKMTGQFLFHVEWGDTDILILDLPPGTGDVQITLTQQAPLNGALIVTTPSALALEDVLRGVQLFRQTAVPILGLIENMSYFVCSRCHQKSAIFGEVDRQHYSTTFGVPLLDRIPLDPQMRVCADAGTPLVHQAPGALASQVFTALACQLIQLLKHPPD